MGRVYLCSFLLYLFVRHVSTCEEKVQYNRELKFLRSSGAIDRLTLARRLRPIGKTAHHNGIGSN